MNEFNETTRPAGINETRDCTVLALSNGLDVAYHRALAFLADAGRRPKHGVRLAQVIKRKRGCILGHKLTLVKRSGSLAKFIQQFPIGRFIITVRQHAFAVVDGVVHDHSRQSPRRHILRAWKVEPYFNVAALQEGYASDALARATTCPGEKPDGATSATTWEKRRTRWQAWKNEQRKLDKQQRRAQLLIDNDDCAARADAEEEQQNANHVDGYDRDDLGESSDY